MNHRLSGLFSSLVKESSSFNSMIKNTWVMSGNERLISHTLFYVCAFTYCTCSYIDFVSSSFDVLLLLSFFCAVLKSIHLIYCAFIAASLFSQIQETIEYFMCCLCCFIRGLQFNSFNPQIIVFNDMTYFTFLYSPSYSNPLPHQKYPWPIYFLFLSFFFLLLHKSQKQYYVLCSNSLSHTKNKLSSGMKSWYFLFFMLMMTKL